MKTLLLLSLLFSTIVPGVPVPEDSTALVEVSWNRKTYPGNGLPDEVGDGPTLAVATWAPWCLAHEYQMTLVPDGRVLLISPRKNGKLGRQMKLVAETMEEFDAILPAPERTQPAVAPEPESPGKSGGDDIPEDPEGGLAGWRNEDEEPLDYSYEYEWGSGTWPVDTETCVMFVVDGEKDYGSLVDTLGEMEEYLRPWVKTGKTLTGFVHEKPLVAAYVENAVAQEEWDPENELVHRVAQMLFVRRFASIQPYWIAQGFSWYLEDKIRGSIYCFPYRHEFVYATEHSGWDNELRNMFKDREDDPPRAAEFADWKRGKYDGVTAKMSYGLVGYIVRFHGDGFSPLLEKMRLFALEDSKQDLGGGSWSRNESYSISAKDQERFLKESFGTDCLVEAGEFFRKGKRFKPKR